MLNFNQLYYFKAIAECGSISKASEVVFVSQSGLSKSLHELELELECKLFERKGKRLVLNKFGEHLLILVSEIITLTDKIKYEISEMRLSDNAQLSIDTYYPFILEILAPAILSSFPNIGLEGDHSYKPPDKIINNLGTDIIDFSVISLSDDEFNKLYPFMNKQNIKYILLIRETLYLTTPKVPPYIRMKSCKIEEILDDSLIKTIGPVHSDIWFENIAKSRKVTPHYLHVFDTNTFLSMWKETPYNYITTSLYASYIDYFKGLNNNRTLIKIDDPIATKNVYLLYRECKEAFLKPFLDILIANFYKQFTSKN